MHDLNHPKVTAFTRAVASQLGLDLTFVDFVFSKERPACFEYWCEDVNRGWTCFVPDNIDIAYPLWSTNADQTLILVAGSAISYAKGWHDNPDMEFISQTSQGLLADLLNQIWESDASEEEMRVAAQVCGFRYLGEFFELTNEPRPKGIEWEPKWRQFILQIDAKEQRSGS